MSAWTPHRKTALLLTASGEQFFGYGIGATGHTVAEVCFNTAMTGYQEILTDPSYAEQIVTFTFPHIGNVGTNDEDVETSNTTKPRAASGLIIREAIPTPANYRNTQNLDDWLKANGLIGMSGVDTRAITAHIREHGMFNAVLAHAPDGHFDIAALAAELAGFKGLEGADLAADVTNEAAYGWNQTRWQWGEGFSENTDGPHVVALDYGVKKNILRCLATAGCRITVLPASSTAEQVLAENPDGVFLSNGPGDPAATGDYAVGEIEKLVASGLPIFGICLGHQMLARALGAKTVKMKQGHHGANHPVKDLTTGKVEITSMNHGFTVDRDTLPATLEETHISLFDGTNCGIQLKGKPVFSVQHHPEASPGPQDSHYLFDRFVASMTDVMTSKA
jgi:carbamoyl-phosphate synthase small subunit